MPMTVDEALTLYAKPQTTQAELALMVLAGHALAREVHRLRVDLDIEKKLHAKAAEHAWAEAVCATATSTDQVRAGLDKWHTSMTKVKLENSKEDS